MDLVVWIKRYLICFDLVIYALCFKVPLAAELLFIYN